MTSIKMNFGGSIQLILGPMFSGKSTELIRKARRYGHARKSVLIVSYQHDNRYSKQEVVSTHDKQYENAVKATLLSEIKDLSKYDVVAIDEGQFFADIYEGAEQLANQGKIVVIAALDGTFQRKPFGKIVELIARAERVMKLSSVCVHCLEKAYFTKRTVDDQRIELIGGGEMYQPVCRRCYFQQHQNDK